MNQHLRIFILSLLVSLSSSVALAQAPETEAGEQTPSTVSSGAESEPVVEAEAEPQSSYRVRDELSRILAASPPTLTRLLQLDPTLLSNGQFLEPYPALRAFLADHPEIRHDAGFYLGAPPSARPRSVVGDIMESLAILGSILIVVLAMAWLIRSFIEQRRWSRLSRTQSEVHNKILDRFTTNEELIAYVGTPAGRKFLESAPINVGSEETPKSLPITRILWSVQLGIVIGAAAIGLLLVHGRFGSEDAQSLFAMGVIALCLGAGFIGSGALSLYLSRRFGLWETGEASESPRSAGIV